MHRSEVGRNAVATDGIPAEASPSCGTVGQVATPAADPATLPWGQLPAIHCALRPALPLPALPRDTPIPTRTACAAHRRSAPLPVSTALTKRPSRHYPYVPHEILCTLPPHRRYGIFVRCQARKSCPLVRVTKGSVSREPPDGNKRGPGVASSPPTIAAIFPGVGAQYTGMGSALRDRHKIYRDTLDEACDLLGADWADVIYNPAQKSALKRQEESQLAVLVTGVAMFRVFEEDTGVPVSFCAGHSLGEYTALCCAGALTLSDAIRLVRRRARLIRRASDALHGTMMWVVHLDPDVVGAACAAAREEGCQVYVSAYDAPRQVAISGDTDDVTTVARELEARGALVYPLRLEGPYHSPLMRSAADGMADLLTEIPVRAPAVPVLSGVRGQHHQGGAQSAELLARQLVEPVRWLDVQHALVGENVCQAVEFGPGTVLTFLAEKTSPSLRVVPFDGFTGEGELSAAMFLAEEQYPEVIDRCLRTAVSTRTLLAGVPSRHEAVVARYRELESLRERPVPAGGDIDQALGILDALLESKGLREDERAVARNRVLAGRLWPR
ncbi:ACP S-malonyltransferase [Streptomyces sp. NPDC090445]|uniref:ACP S-malonyltransferase n=1 Tax=Streptomyces sp. NPDC090445 TaxID=3365963 RepID=UPI00380584BE